MQSLLSGSHWTRIEWDLFYFISWGQGKGKQAQFTSMYLCVTHPVVGEYVFFK